MQARGALANGRTDALYEPADERSRGDQEAHSTGHSQQLAGDAWHESEPSDDRKFGAPTRKPRKQTERGHPGRNLAAFPSAVGSHRANGRSHLGQGSSWGRVYPEG